MGEAPAGRDRDDDGIAVDDRGQMEVAKLGPRGDIGEDARSVSERMNARIDLGVVGRDDAEGGAREGVRALRLARQR